MSASGFPGKRVEANRAGMTATICSGGPESTAEPVDAGCTTNHNTIVRGRMLRSPALLMNWKSTATIGVVGGTVATLARHGVAVARIADRRRRSLRRRRSTCSSGAALAAETARLRERLRPQVRAAQRRPAICSRSRAAAAAPAPTRSDRSSRAAGRTVVRRRPMPPPFTLVGLAEDAAPGRHGQDGDPLEPAALQFVKEGDRVDGGYRVAAISSDSVELLGDDGRPLLLRLK